MNTVSNFQIKKNAVLGKRFKKREGEETTFPEETLLTSDAFFLLTIPSRRSSISEGAKVEFAYKIFWNCSSVS